MDVKKERRTLDDQEIKQSLVRGLRYKMFVEEIVALATAMDEISDEQFRIEVLGRFITFENEQLSKEASPSQDAV